MLSVIVPAYNEEATIEEFLVRLVDVLGTSSAHFSSWQVVVVSDGSTDRTADIARSVARSEIQVLEITENGGKGAALRAGFQMTKGDLVAFCDGDLDIDPVGIIVLLDLMRYDRYDAIVGSKVHPNSQVNYPIYRRIQSHAFRVLTKSMFNLAIHDTQTGLKIFKRECLQSSIHKVYESGFAFDLELLARVGQNFRIGEGPVRINYQFRSSIGIRAPFEMLLSTFRIWRRLRASEN